MVIAGILHDLIEDTDCRIEQVKNKFGPKVAKLVSACSFDESIKNKKEKYKELFSRVRTGGRDVLIVKAADILDNSNYFDFIETPKIKKEILEIWNYFLNDAKEISSEPIYQELLNKIHYLNKKQS